MGTILVKNAMVLATMDKDRREIEGGGRFENVGIFRDGKIRLRVFDLQLD